MLQGDGVYSRYIPNLPKGKFSVNIFVEGNIGQFKFARHLRLGIVNVVSSTPNEDSISPSRIVDLRMAVLPDTPSKVSFTWTAPGNDFDFGIADRYMVKVGPTPDLERGEFSYIEDWPEPLPASSIQQHTLDWNIYDTVRYVGLFALDEEGNTSPISNVVSVFVPHPPTTTAAPSVFHSVHVSSPSEITEKNSIYYPTSGMNLIIIIALCVVGLFLLISVVVCIVSRQKKKTDKKASDIPKAFNPNVSGSNEKNFSDRTDSKESIKKEFISPVESWSASQLLGGHQDNKRSSMSARSDDNSDHSDSTKKSYTGFSATNDFYGSSAHFPYNTPPYPENYPPPSESYPTPTEGYPTPTEGYPSTEVYPPEGYPVPSESRSYVSSPPSESFLSVSCDLLPVSHGPPGYSAYPGYDATLRAGGKVPPPIPPKPRVMYNPEPYQFDSQDSSSASPSITGQEKRVRNVTMV